MLTVGLITVVFYNHPSTTNATLFFRTVPIISEAIGRVAEVNVGFSAEVKEGEPIFRLDSSTQQAAAESGASQDRRDRRRPGGGAGRCGGRRGQGPGGPELLSASRGRIGDQAGAQPDATPPSLRRARSKSSQNAVEGRQGAVAAATAAKDSDEAQISALLPAQRASAEAALAQAEVELAKTVIRAGVSGRVEQFTLRVGDIVNPIMRPAGILIPDGAGRGTIQAGFGQIEAQVMKLGMIAEVTCVSKPWTIIPMVVTGVQDFIAAGQFRGGEQLIDPQQVVRPGTILVTLEPLYEGGLDGVTPGSSCIANAYTSNHDLIASGKLGTVKGLALHAVDAVGLVHAAILRIQALLLPIQTLVLRRTLISRSRRDAVGRDAFRADFAGANPVLRRCAGGDAAGH